MAADVRSVTVGGRTFNVVAGRHDNFWDTCEAGWEATTFEVLTSQPGPASTFVDVGAWIGPMTLVAAACGARVVAYEPDPTAADELAENIAANPGFDVDVRTGRAVDIDRASRAARRTGWARREHVELQWAVGACWIHNCRDHRRARCSASRGRPMHW